MLTEDQIVNLIDAHPEIQKWLDEYQNRITNRNMRLSMKYFLTSIQMKPEDFIKLSSKDAKHLVLKYQAQAKKDNVKDNTILSNITAPRALFKYLEKPMRFGRGRLVKVTKAQNRHTFSNGDLSKMFDVADIRGKAIIATASSLGWAMSDFRALDRQKIEALIARAKENDEQFIFFKTERKKTGAKTLAVLNPIAIEWLEKYFAISEGTKVFNLSHDQINADLKKFAEEAQLRTTGNVSFHAFRGWVMSSLVKAGFSEFETKYVVGKTIPLSDETYLSLEEGVKEKYTEKYADYLSIKKFENLEKSTKIEELKQAIEHIETENSTSKTRIDLLQETMEKLKKKNKDLEAKLEETSKIKWEKIKEIFDEKLKEAVSQNNKIEAKYANLRLAKKYNLPEWEEWKKKHPEFDERVKKELEKAKKNKEN